MKTVAQAIYDNTDKIPCEAFTVMTNRRNGTLPTYEKACDDKWYHSQEEAERVRDQYNKDIGPYYSVYRVIITVEERLG